MTFHANMFQIHGGGLSRGALLNFMDVSGIEALPSTRLYEAWFERKWGTNLALRAGSSQADTEFMTAKYTEVFTNASLGWPAGLSLNLPSGGPSPPLAAVGARLRADITDNLTVLGAVFNGDSAGPGADDPQLRNRYGVNFRINDPPLVLGEAQFLWNGKKGDPGLDGKFKLGAWRHFGLFSDQRFEGQGFRLRTLRQAECRGCCAEISGSMRSSSRKYIGSARTTTAASASSRGLPTVRLTETSSTITRTPGSNSSASRTGGRRTSSDCGRLRSRLAAARALDLDFQRLLTPVWPARSFEGLVTAVYQYECGPDGPCSQTFSSSCDRAAARPTRSQLFRQGS